MSDFDYHERRRAAEEALLDRLGGYPRLREILGRLLHPIAGVRRAELREDLQGVDYWVDRSGARSLGVDVKCREDDWPDLLIEFESNSTTHAPGWTINEANITDLVLYLMPGSEVLVPYPQLRAATIHNLPEWVERYPESRNTTTTGGAYRTRWIAVPDAVVLAACGMRVTGQQPSWTAATRPFGPRCPKCSAAPIAQEPAFLDPTYVRYRDEHGHSWEGRAA